MVDYLAKNLERARKLYPSQESLILPLLYKMQERDGYVTPEAMQEIADETGATPAFVQSVASFYTMYFKKKVGKNVIAVCTNISCELCKGDELLKALRSLLSVENGGTTKDEKITLLEVECLGSCGTAPVVQVNNDYIENATFEGMVKIVEDLIQDK